MTVRQDDTDDDALAARAAEGDREAFRALVERHYDRVYRILLALLANAADAEDATQEIWAALPARLGGWRGEARFTTWLHQIALNAGRDALRRSGARSRAAARFAESDSLARADAHDASQRRRWLEAALQQLDPALRETAALVLADGMAHAEAAAILGVAESTVSWRMSEIRKRLRALARDEMNDDAAERAAASETNASVSAAPASTAEQSR